MGQSIFKPIMYITCKMHSLDTKYKAVVHYTHFLQSLRKVSNIYKVSKSSLQRWVMQVKPEFKKRRNLKAIKDELKSFIEQSLSSNPFLTMESLSKLCKEKCGLKRSSRTFCRYMSIK
jgi:transposase